MILAVKIPCNGPLFEPVSGLSDLSSLDQVSTELPRGVYTTFRTYLRSYAYDLEDHFQRLVNSASLVGNQITLDSGRIRAAIRQILPSLEGEEFRIRISIDLESESCTAFVLIDKLVQPLEEDYRNGIKTLTRIFHRENPEAKSTEFISKSKNFRRLISGEVNEVLLCEPAGEIMEGLSSNFFGVMENKIFTAGEGVLSGITRALVLEEAGNYHIEVVYRPINLNEISRLSEAFLTSTSRAVLPVRQIDECMIGSGSPGPVSEILARAYLERVKRGLEEI